MLIRPPRLCYDGFERVWDEAAGLCKIAVNLSFETQQFRGEAQGNAGEDNELELVAQATLQAVETFTQHRFHCQLLDVDRIEAIGNELVVLLVNISYQGQELQIFGSCRTNENIFDAAARASLDATNRYVELTMTGNEQNSAINGSLPTATC